MRARVVVFLILFLFPSISYAFETGRQPFTATVNGESIEYATGFVPVMPGEIVDITVPGEGAYELLTPDGATPVTTGNAQWTSPQQQGVYPLQLRREDGASITVQVLVMVPASQIKNGRLNGYLIGDYPSEPLKGLDIYNAPEGFIEVTPETAQLRISPHFTLGQFLCKQESAWPKYVLLRPRLIAKLERVLEELNERGFGLDGLTVMSGYRTPAYNKALGNVQYSRHVWGGAADIYVDGAPADGWMDDIDGDQQITRADATSLYEIVEGMSQRADMASLSGGLGEYGATSAHGPFIHVDVRGSSARWGYTGKKLAANR